jgi:hypothetical protein
MSRVLFIAGNGRSGSTILHNVLGQIDGFAAVGELRYIWGAAALGNQTCGCGARFRACPFWNQVMTRAFNGLDLAYARRMLEFTESFRLHRLPLTTVPALRRRELARLREYLDGLSRLYAAIQETSGCRVTVDSSKNPSYGYLLRDVRGIEPYYLQFVRDVPAVAYSWSRPEEFEPGVPMARKAAHASALQWVARNLAADLFLRPARGRRMLMRYEEFVARPRDSVIAVLEWLGESGRTLPFASSHEVDLDRRNHSVFGNRVRFRIGRVAISADEQWRAALLPHHRRMVTALTWPVRARYGYLGRRRPSGIATDRATPVAGEAPR